MKRLILYKKTNVTISWQKSFLTNYLQTEDQKIAAVTD